MKKNIWIINEYAGTPEYGMEFRHYYLAKELVKAGYTTTIISASYSHLFQNFPKKKMESIDGIEYLWIKIFNYGMSNNKKRVLKWFLFMSKLFFLPLKLKKPDIIIMSSIAPFSIFPAYILAKIYRAKLIFEVKDIWPLSLIEIGGFKVSHPLIKLMSFAEKFALKKADIIVSNLQNYGEHINNLGINRKFKWISNGIDLQEIKNVELLDNTLIKKIPTDKFIVGYTGSIGMANALESFLESAILLEDRKDIVFIIVGKGTEKKSLKEKFESDNILFIDAIDKKQIQSMLGYFDVCFLGWNKENLYKYGTSPNKLFDYMYSATPIINAFSGAGDIVKIAQCGITVEAHNTKKIADAIIKLNSLSPVERKNMGINGKHYVIDNFSYSSLARNYIGLF